MEIKNDNQKLSLLFIWSLILVIYLYLFNEGYIDKVISIFTSPLFLDNYPKIIQYLGIDVLGFLLFIILNPFGFTVIWFIVASGITEMEPTNQYWGKKRIYEKIGS